MPVLGSDGRFAFTASLADEAAPAHRDRLAAKIDTFWRRESAFVPSGPLAARLPRARIDLPAKD